MAEGDDESEYSSAAYEDEEESATEEDEEASVSRSPTVDSQDI
jgi:hypothetical protein